VAFLNFVNDLRLSVMPDPQFIEYNFFCLQRNLRCYNIAKLYYSVNDLDSARHYISSFLSVRPDHAGAHKVLGQAYEGLKEKEKALEAYKRSLELESKQPDLVFKGKYLLNFCTFFFLVFLSFFNTC